MGAARKREQRADPRTPTPPGSTIPRLGSVESSLVGFAATAVGADVAGCPMPPGGRRQRSPLQLGRWSPTGTACVSSLHAMAADHARAPASRARRDTGRRAARPDRRGDRQRPERRYASVRSSSSAPSGRRGRGRCPSGREGLPRGGRILWITGARWPACVVATDLVGTDLPLPTGRSWCMPRDEHMFWRGAAND